MGKAACRGQGARRLQPRGQGSEAMLRAEETGRTSAATSANPRLEHIWGKWEKERRRRRVGGCGFALAAQGITWGCPIRSAKPALRMGWQCPIHPRGFLDSGCAGWCPMCTKSPHTVERDFPFSPLPPHHPALPTPRHLYHESYTAGVPVEDSQGKAWWVLPPSCAAPSREQRCFATHLL